MTSSLRRKRRITVPGKSTPSRTGFSLACLLAVLAAGRAPAQVPPARPVWTAAPATSVVPPPPAPPTSMLGEPQDRRPASSNRQTATSPTATGTFRTIYFQKPATPSAVRTVSQFVAQAQKDVTPKVKELEAKTSYDDLLRYQIRLEPPGPELVFRLESEAALEQRMRQEAKQQNLMETVVFPELPILSKVGFQGRSFPQQVAFAEPRYVNYRRLLFEEKNAERYGWDLGIIQPILSSVYFYKDFLLLPNNVASYPLRRYDTSAGNCLPGDPVPYILYPPEITPEGLFAELGVGTGLSMIFP